jgi:CDGSH-type Zn-finger protein
VPNGPLYVRGSIEVRDADGSIFRRDTRLALCRCGQSRNKPFCDNSHRQAGFRDAGRLARPIAPVEQADT